MSEVFNFESFWPAHKSTPAAFALKLKQFYGSSVQIPSIEGVKSISQLLEIIETIKEVKEIKFASDFNEPIESENKKEFEWPSECEMTHLSIGLKFNQPLQSFTFPSSLTRLTLDGFNQTLAPGVLPSSLLWLTLNNFNRPIEPGVLP